MKRPVLILFICLLFLSIGCSRQIDYSGIFQSDLKTLFDAYNRTDWIKITGMIYPGFFKVVSKNRIILTLKTLDSLGVKRTFILKEIGKISDIISSGEIKYCRINYNTEIIVELAREQLNDLQAYKDDYTEDYGKNNVAYDDQLHQFRIKTHQSIIAVMERNSDVWKYMELNNDHAFDLVSQVVPKEVMTELMK